MTVDHTPLSRTKLADLLIGAAHHIAGILTAEYPTPPSRSYLHPVLGALSAGPGVVGELTDRLEGSLDDPLPDTPAGLFALASYAAALGWLTESLAELTEAVDLICTQVGIADEPSAVSALAPAREQDDTDQAAVEFSGLELAAIRSAAEAAGMASGTYMQALSQAVLAATRITDACIEIATGLTEDATYVRDDAGQIRIGNSPDSLPTLVRTLLTRMETAR